MEASQGDFGPLVYHRGESLGNSDICVAIMLILILEIVEIHSTSNFVRSFQDRASECLFSAFLQLLQAPDSAKLDKSEKQGLSNSAQIQHDRIQLTYTYLQHIYIYIYTHVPTYIIHT